MRSLISVRPIICANTEVARLINLHANVISVDAMQHVNGHSNIFPYIPDTHFLSIICRLKTYNQGICLYIVNIQSVSWLRFDTWPPILVGVVRKL